MNSVGLEGAKKDEVLVIGEGVDAISLAATMRKKVGHTDIFSVAEVKEVISSDASSSSPWSSSFILQYINIKLIKMLPF